MSKCVKLIHPKHGIVAQENIRGKLNEESITYNWMKKYGSKFRECEVVVVGNKPERVKF